jgi:hypothetical protein
MNDLRKTFRSEPAAYLIMFRGLILGLGALIIVATIAGQIKAGRFPAYEDLAISTALPVGAYIFIAAVIYLCSWLFAVRIGPAGIKSFNMFGMPRLVAWHEIVSAEFREMQGVPYIFIKSAGKLQPMTVPVWLRDPQGFVDAVREYADRSNPLVQLLDEAEAAQGSQSLD